MKIYLMRHYKVKMDYQERYDSSGYMRDSIEYNQRDVYPGEPSAPAGGRLYASCMKRAIRTAQLAFGKTPQILPGIHEVTMKNCVVTTRQKSFIWWEAMARLHWFFNNPSQYETRHETFARLATALDYVEAQGEDATLVMHGHAMRCMAYILKKRGYRGKYILNAKNGAVYCYQRDNL